MIAGAPISWGVSEVPGWGHQLRPERVLAEMRELGLTATEAGPDGFLPDDPAALRDYLAAYELELASGFTPLVLHADWRAPLDAVARRFAAAGAGVVVLAARVADGSLGFSRAVRDGVFLRRGHGDSDVHAVLEHMREAGYAGWYVFEQDAQLAAEPEPGEGPRADVARSLAYLDAVIAS